MGGLCLLPLTLCYGVWDKINFVVSSDLQEYLKQFNELFGELQAKKVGVMAVCAQPQDKVDDMMKQCDLKFKVRLGRMCSRLSSKIANRVSTIFVGH